MDTDPLDSPQSFSGDARIRQAIAQKGSTAFNVQTPATFKLATRADGMFYYTGADRQNERFNRAGDLHLIQVTPITGFDGKTISEAVTLGSLYVDWTVEFDIPQINPPTSSGLGNAGTYTASVAPQDIVWPEEQGAEAEIKLAELNWFDELGSPIDFGALEGQNWHVASYLTQEEVTFGDQEIVSGQNNKLALSYQIEDRDELIGVLKASEQTRLADILVLVGTAEPDNRENAPRAAQIFGTQITEYGYNYGVAPGQLPIYWTFSPIAWLLSALTKFKIGFGGGVRWKKGDFSAGLRFEISPAGLGVGVDHDPLLQQPFL
jgi:hypothetical protein